MFTLNYDCIKDILIYLQNNLEYTQGTVHKKINWCDIYTDKGLCDKYSQTDIMYNLEKIIETRFVRTSMFNFDKNTREVMLCFIDDITMTGHDFLCNAQNETIWKNVKGKISSFGKVSLPIFLKLLADEGWTLLKELKM